MQDRNAIPFLSLANLSNGRGPSSPCSLREVVAGRLNALIAETEARRDWLRHIGIQGPLQFAWVLSKAQQITGQHFDALNRESLASLRQGGKPGSQNVDVPMLEFDRVPTLTRPSSGNSARLLYRSFHYSWVNYEFILFVSEEWISPANAAVLQRLSREASQLLKNLESFDPTLADIDGEVMMPGPKSGGMDAQRAQRFPAQAPIAIEFPSGRYLKL